MAAGDVDELKKHGFSDAEVFDIAAVVSARAFWTGIVVFMMVDFWLSVWQLHEQAAWSLPFILFLLFLRLAFTGIDEHFQPGQGLI